MLGVELAQRLKQRAPRVPVILLSGQGFEYLADQTPDAIDAVVAKPVQMDELQAILDEVMARATAAPAPMRSNR